MRYGALNVTHDTGAPAGVAEYKTLIFFHGFGLSSDVFTRLLPFAAQHACRVVLVNRRGFPGSEPYSDAELDQMRMAQAGAREISRESLKAFFSFVRGRALEVYTLLEQFIAGEKPPVNSILPVFWSMSNVLGTALLTHAHDFPIRDIEVWRYIRRVVALDPPGSILGYSRKEPYYAPVFDPDILPEDRHARFALWISGYYTHGADGTSYEDRTPVDDPPPTTSTMEPAQLSEMMGEGFDSDMLFASSMLLEGAEALRQSMMYLEAESGWNQIEWRHVWCERTIWDCAFGGWEMKRALEQMRSTRVNKRKATLVQWKGSNHFPHWEFPERTLTYLLEDGQEDRNVQTR